MHFPPPARMQLVDVLIGLHRLLEHSDGDAWEIVSSRLRELITATTMIDDDELESVGLLGPELDVKLEAFRTAMHAEQYPEVLRVAAVIVRALGRLPQQAQFAFPVADYVSVVPSAKIPVALWSQAKGASGARHDEN